MTSTTEVLVVGAGPTGLTLALDLARRDVAVRIVDAAPGPSPASRAKGIQPRTLEVFDDLGVVDAILRTARPYPPMRAYRGSAVVWDGELGDPRQPSPDVPYPSIVMLPQWRTEEVLREHLPVEVEYDTAVTGVRQDADGVTATLADGRTIRAAYLVGADGGRSTIRRALGVEFLGETFETERMAIADVRFAPGLLDHDHWHVWGDLTTQDLRLGLCPLPGTDVFQLTAPLAPDEDPGDLQHFVTARTGRDDLVIEATPWRSRYRVNIRLASRYRVGRAFLAGDAAHAHSPAGGQGLNTGVQDAYNLGWKLASGSDALLDTYEAERQPVAADVLGLSTLLLRGSSEAPRRGRDTDQLDVHYRGSALAVDLRREPGALRSGDRAPDAVLPDGTLFDRFRGPHPTVLTFRPARALGDVGPGAVEPWDVIGPGDVGSGDAVEPRDAVEPQDAAEVVLGDDAPGARASYGFGPGTGGYVVVRPDGYVGLLADADGAAAARDYVRGLRNPRRGGVGAR